VVHFAGDGSKPSVPVANTGAVGEGIAGMSNGGSLQTHCPSYGGTAGSNPSLSNSAAILSGPET